MRTLTLPVVIILGSLTQANAYTVLDQSHEFAHENGVGSFGGVFSAFSAAQTFTVGISGELSSVDLCLIDIGTNNDADVFASIVPVLLSGTSLVVDALLNPPLAVSGSVSGTTIPEYESYVSFDLSGAHLRATVGQMFAVIVSSQGAAGSEFQIRGYHDGVADSYGGGEAYHGAGLADPFNFDFGFRTYVTVVPIPPVVWLFGSALGLMGWLRRKTGHRI